MPLLVALLALVLPASAIAVEPSTPQLRAAGVPTTSESSGFVLSYRMTPGEAVTKFQYRYMPWATEVWEEWKDVELAAIACSSAEPLALHDEVENNCGFTNSGPLYAAFLPVSWGFRYDVEFRAVNEDGASGTLDFTRALPVSPDSRVTFADPMLENFVRRQRNIAPGVAVTQLHMAQMDWLVADAGYSDPYHPAPRIKDLGGLEHAHNLEVLRTSFHLYTDISPLAELANLRSYWNLSSLLTDISPLRNLTNLEGVSLNRGNPVDPPPYDQVIEDASPLSGLTKLKLLQLCDQRVGNEEQLAALVDLEELSLCRNDLDSISSLRNMTKVRRLSIHGNRIEDIGPLSGMTQLEYLSMLNNRVADITPLAKLTRLKTLRMHSNRVVDVSPLARLTNLEFLQLHNNRIRDLSGLEALVKVKHIDLSGNPLDAGIQTLVTMATRGALKLVDLRGDTQVDSEGIALLRSSGLTVLHDADIRPAMPQGLAGTSGEHRGTTLTWTDPSNADIVAYQWRHRLQGADSWSDWKMTPQPPAQPFSSSRKVYWVRGPADLTEFRVSGLPGGQNEIEFRATAVSDYDVRRIFEDAAKGRLSRVKTHKATADAAGVGARTSTVGRVFISSPAASVTVEVVSLLDDLTLASGQSGEVDLAEAFADVDGATFTVVSSNEEVATATVDGSVLKVTTIEPGEAEVTVIATDENGVETRREFIVTAFATPPMARAVDALGLLTFGDSAEIDLVGSFDVSAGGEPLTFSVVSSDPSLASATLSADGVLTVTANMEGLSGSLTVDVTATDARGLTAPLSIRVDILTTRQLLRGWGWRLGLQEEREE